MADFIIDDSIQTSALFSQGSIFTTKTNPNVRLSSTAGVYYPSENNFRVYTNLILLVYRDLIEVGVNVAGSSKKRNLEKRPSQYA